VLLHPANLLIEHCSLCVLCVVISSLLDEVSFDVTNSAINDGAVSPVSYCSPCFEFFQESRYDLFNIFELFNFF
jgi:hypothetical protein